MDEGDRPGAAGQGFGLRDVLAPAGLALFIVLVVGLQGAFSAAPGLVDDIQIFKLDREIADEGFAAVVQSHFTDRFERLGRFVPVFLAYKLLSVQFFGTNLVLWAASGLAIGVAGATLLFAAGRAMRLTTAEALYLSLITVLGEQSVIWWRLLHGEGIGMLFFALGILCLAMGARGTRWRVIWDAAAVLAITAATLSKESFIITVPGLCALRLWLEAGEDRPWTESLKRNAVMFGTLLIVALCEILLILFVIKRTSFWYTGWKGFDIEDLLTILYEFFGGYRLWFVFSTVLLGVILVTTAQTFVAAAGPSIRRVQIRFAGLSLVAALLIAPQLLLYKSSGFFSGPETHDMSRYLVPATVGIGLLAAAALGMAREWIPRVFGDANMEVFGRRCLQLMHAAIIVPLVLQAAVAGFEAERYFDRKKELGTMLAAVAESTDRDDVILLAYNQATARDTRRLSILLDGYVGRANLFYVPIAPTGAQGTSPIEWFEYDRYAEFVEARTISDPAALRGIKAFIIVHADEVEPETLKQNRYWFDVTAHKRIRSDDGHVLYVIDSAPTEGSGLLTTRE